MNELPCYVCSISKQNLSAKSVILSFSKHTYITATVPETVIFNLLSQEDFLDPNHKRILCVNSAACFNQNTQATEIPPLYSIRRRNASTLQDCDSPSQRNELPDREVAELHHSKTRPFSVTTTENSHAPVFLVMAEERLPTSHFLVLNQCNG